MTSSKRHALKPIALCTFALAIVAGAACSSSPSGISQATADSWPDKWCTAQPGSTKEALVAVMGEPTRASDESLTWSAHQYQFNAFLNADGTVRQLDINRHSLSEAEKAGLKCDPVRTADSVASAPASAERTGLKACAMVTQAEMSAILGAAVIAEPNDRSNGKTECVYKAASGVSPYVELSVDWGSGEAAMMATGMMSKIEPGLTSPYAGIGDQASAVGPMLMIRTGDDLMTIVFSGVDDLPGKAKAIFTTAKARM
jgi:hypothetical protein